MGVKKITDGNFTEKVRTSLSRVAKHSVRLAVFEAKKHRQHVSEFWGYAMSRTLIYKLLLLSLL
jgi:hypothetical protein